MFLCGKLDNIKVYILIQHIFIENKAKPDPTEEHVIKPVEALPNEDSEDVTIFNRVSK